MTATLDDDGRAEHAQALVSETLAKLTRWLAADGAPSPGRAATMLIIDHLVTISMSQEGVAGAVFVAETAVLC